MHGEAIVNLPTACYAMFQTAPRKLEPREISMTKVSDDAGPMRIDACGICGNDYERFEGGLCPPMPALPGHEPLSNRG